MDFFKGISNFFNGVFGGNKKDDEERKRREREAAAKRAAQAQAKPKPQPSAESGLVGAKVQKPQPIQQPQPKPVQSLNDFMGKPKLPVAPKIEAPLQQPKPLVVQPVTQAVTPEQIQEKKRQRSEVFAYGGFRKQPAQVFLSQQEIEDLKKQSRAAAPQNPYSMKNIASAVYDETVDKPIIQPLRDIKEQATVANAMRKRGVDPSAEVIFRSNPQASKKFDETVKQAEKETGAKRDVGKGIEAVLSTGFNLAGAGEIATLGRSAVSSQLAKLEERLGRKLTKEEAEKATERINDRLKEVGIKESPEKLTDEAVDAIKPKPSRENLPHAELKNVEMPEIRNRDFAKEKQKVADSYKKVFNQISNDKNLTPQQQVEYITEAKNRHAALLKEIDDGVAAQQKIVADQAKAQADQEKALVDQVKQAEEAKQIPEEAIVQERSAAPDTKINDQQYRQMQDERKAERTQNPVVDFLQKVRREVADPRAVQQKLDNQELKRLKQEGLLPDAVRDTPGSQSLVTLRGRIENPQRAAEVRDNTKYTINNNTYTLNSIIKHYGKEEGDKARSFENYRLYKDELERIYRGAKNSIGVDPQEMAAYVQQYERVNPLAAEHNAVLRQYMLDQLRAKSAARIDDPGLLEAAQNFQFYNPRQALDPENLIRPGFNGGVRSGAKQTQLRSQTAGGEVRSPLSLFKSRSVETEKALAEQEYGLLLRDRARRGEKGFNEVINADVAVAHKEALRTMKDLSDQIKQLQTVAKSAKGELKTAKQVQAAKDEAVTLTRDYLRKAGDSDIMSDMSAYADTITDKEALNLFDVLTGVGTNNTERLAKKISKDTGTTPEQVKEFIVGVRAAIKDAKVGRSDAFNDMMETTQNLERGTQTYTYKLDGEVGKVEIPVDLAEELAKANEAMTVSPVEKGMQGLANVQKITWTGALSPVFKFYNVMVKNPLLAYRNADGLSALGFRPLMMAIGDAFNVPAAKAFREEILKRGASYENALQTRNLYSTTADDIAARSNLFTFFNRNPMNTLEDVWKGLNNFIARPDNAQRTQVAYGAYLRAKRLRLSEQEALDIAAQAPAKVFGDFDRVSRLARNAEIILPYSGAIQAGARSLARASKTKPIETALKDATFLATAGGFTAYSLGNSADYHKDMIESGKEYELDNNWTIVLPGAHRDEKGNWTGVVKVPLTPDLRPYNRAVWRTVYDQAGGGSFDGNDVAMMAGELFNQFTGDMVNSVYDKSRTDNGNNPLNGVLSGSPTSTILKVFAGANPRDGQPLADEFTARLPRTEQANDFTSPGAMNISKLTNGLVTPLQADAILDQLGGAGDTIQGRQDEEGNVDRVGSFFNFGKPLTPGKGASDKSKAYKPVREDMDVVKSTITDEKTFKEFEALHTKKPEDQKKNLLTSAQKAFNFMKYEGDGSFTTTPLFEAERKLDELARARGQAGNPIFDLPPQALQKVLTYRAGKIYNAAKQNYTKNGEGAFQSLGLDEKWYSDFQKAESAYYKQILGGKESEEVSFSGKPKPKLTEEQQALEDAYYSLPSKSAERRAFLANNSWLKDYWAAGNEFTDEERRALGFNSLDGDNVYDGNTGDGYGYGKGGRGGGDYRNDYNVLNEILNTAGGAKRLESQVPKDKEVQLALAKLFAPRRGGRASVTIGAKASGR